MAGRPPGTPNPENREKAKNSDTMKQNRERYEQNKSEGRRSKPTNLTPPKPKE